MSENTAPGSTMESAVEPSHRSLPVELRWSASEWTIDGGTREAQRARGAHQPAPQDQPRGPAAAAARRRLPSARRVAHPLAAARAPRPPARIRRPGRRRRRGRRRYGRGQVVGGGRGRGRRPEQHRVGVGGSGGTAGRRRGAVGHVRGRRRSNLGTSSDVSKTVVARTANLEVDAEDRDSRPLFGYYHTHTPI